MKINVNIKKNNYQKEIKKKKMRNRASYKEEKVNKIRVKKNKAR